MARSLSVGIAASLVLSLSVLILFSVPPVFAQTTHHVKVGGVIAGANFTRGIVWFNGFDPGTIVIRQGDTVVWDLIGGLHTVTSTVRLANGSFAFDSSPLFPPEAALGDIAPGKLLAPGAVYELDTSTLALGTYTYACKIHPGMTGTLIVTTGVPAAPVVNVVAGFGDSVFAQQAFAPDNITVARGTIVRWTLLNPTEPHTITGFDSSGNEAWDSSPAFDLPPGPPPFMVQGDSFSWTFDTPGTYTYFCKLHAYKVGDSWVGMVGVVHVVPFASLDVVNTLNSLTTVTYITLGVASLALVVAIYAALRRR